MNTVQIGWFVSTGKATIPLTGTDGFKGQPYNSVLSQIRSLGFTNVTPSQDTSADGQQANNVTRLNVGDGSYPKDKQIVVYYAPQPPTPTTPTSSTQQQCDPSNPDPSCQQGGTTTTSSGPSNGQTSSENPICVVDPQAPGCPNTPTSTKHGGN